jgi:hypothetical protein
LDLRELDAMLTLASFLVDTTQAFLVVVLRCPPIYLMTLCQGHEHLTT